MNLAWKMGAKNLSQPLEAACIKWGIVGRDQCRFLAQLHAPLFDAEGVRLGTLTFGMDIEAVFAAAGP